ncbi:ABC transporter permease [Prolixibacteraceae bacterium]|nr:ABC transporter permease [Prolixibacteraceae bacterium]
MINKINRFIQDYKKSLLTNTINLLGMAIGLAAVILIGWWSLVELSFDRFHKDVEETYRVVVQGEYNGKRDIDITVSPCFSTALPKMMPNIKVYTSIAKDGVKLVQADGKSFYQSGVGMASRNFFTFFDFPLLYGDKAQCLNAPNKIVIDEAVALKLYGTKEAIGKVFEFEGHAFIVSAIMKEMPVNSTIRLHVVGAVDFIFKKYPWASTTWFGFDRFATYYKFMPRTNRSALAEKMKQKIYEVDEDEKRHKTSIVFQPLKEVHLYGPSESYKRLYVLVSLAWVILVVSCLNFSNLFVFTSFSQLKRIAIRRIYGASSFSIVRSLLGRSFVYVLASCGVGMFLSIAMIEMFNEMMNTSILFDFANPMLWIFLISVVFIVSMITTCYPAWVILRTNEIEGIKGLHQSVGSKKVQKLFIVIQFTISIALLSFVMVVNQQFDYLNQRELGLKKDNVMLLSALGQMPEKYSLFRDFVVGQEESLDCCYAFSSPAIWKDGTMIASEATPNDKVHVEYTYVSRNYFDFFGIKVHGECFNTTKSHNDLVVLNRAAAEQLQLKDPKGKRVNINGKIYTVAGVTLDVHRDPFKPFDYPLVYRFLPPKYLSNTHYIMVRTKGETENEVKRVEAHWNRINPNIPFKYSFLSDVFKLKYKTEYNQNRMMSWLVLIALVISLIGMFAMANFTVENRMKEFAIRRVNGATITQIFTLQLFDFMGPIILSYILSIPLFLYFSDQFLPLFAFNVSIGLSNYIIPLFAVLIISLLAVLIQCIKASQVNPVLILRYE